MTECVAQPDMHMYSNMTVLLLLLSTIVSGPVPDGVAAAATAAPAVHLCRRVLSHRAELHRLGCEQGQTQHPCSASVTVDQHWLQQRQQEQLLPAIGAAA